MRVFCAPGGGEEVEISQPRLRNGPVVSCPAVEGASVRAVHTQELRSGRQLHLARRRIASGLFVPWLAGEAQRAKLSGTVELPWPGAHRAVCVCVERKQMASGSLVGRQHAGALGGAAVGAYT